MDIYQKHAHAYAAHTATSDSNAAHERPIVRALLGEVHGTRVLDAGCASGENVGWLLSQGAEAHAIDMSPEMVALVRQRFPAASVTCASLADPLSETPADFFDSVLCSLTIHYLRDWRPTLREFRRVLRKDGKLIVSTHHPMIIAQMVDDYFRTQLVRDYFVLAGEKVAVEYYHRPLEHIVAPFLQAGFRIAAMLEPSFHGKPLFLIIDAVNEK